MSKIKSKRDICGTVLKEPSALNSNNIPGVPSGDAIRKRRKKLQQQRRKHRLPLTNARKRVQQSLLLQLKMDFSQVSISYLTVLGNSDHFFVSVLASLDSDNDEEHMESVPKKQSVAKAKPSEHLEHLYASQTVDDACDDAARLYDELKNPKKPSVAKAKPAAKPTRGDPHFIL